MINTINAWNSSLEIPTSLGVVRFSILPMYDQAAMTIRNFVKPQIINVSLEVENKLRCGIDGWNMAFAWVMQIQSKSMRERDFPFNEPAFQSAKPIGDFLNAILELCQSCLNFVDRTGISTTVGYANAWEWWKRIIFEMEAGHLISSIGGSVAELAPFQPLPSKREIDKGMAEEIEKLEKLENPYSIAMPDLHNLINIAIAINKAKSIDPNITKEIYQFRNVAWTEYLNAYTALKSRIHRDENMVVVQIERGEVRKKHGGKLLSPPKPQGFSIRQQRKKRKNVKDR